VSRTRKSFDENGRLELTKAVDSLIGRFKNEKNETDEHYPMLGCWRRIERKELETGKSARASSYDYEILTELDRIREEGKDDIGEKAEVLTEVFE
jgi:hypothetical protein